MYFLRKLHPLALQNTQFGFANYTGLAAALLFCMLLALSNDVSLRVLRVQRWKSLQRWSYAAFAFTVAHGIAYQWIEKRHLPWILLFAALTVGVVLFQSAGFVRMRKMMNEPRTETGGNPLR
jgi:sulfoxide reductase heme-binding subunit YedZ